jgi:hypothetical protein
VGTNDNRQSLNPGSTEVNQNDVSMRKGISIDNATARPLNDITAPSVLPGGGKSLRTTPSAAFGGNDGKGNRTGR